MLNPCRSAVVSWLLVVAATSTTAKLNCPLYGLGYPKPTNLLASQGIKGAASALDSVFPQFIDNANGTGSARFSYSVEVFSASEDNAPLWSHYWTAKNLAMMNTTGVKKIDGDTVYRIGSLTKVFTMLTFLAEVGDSVWNDPIAKYIPEVADMAANSSGSSHSLTTPDWGSITIGSLASQISGLMRDYAMLGELTQTLTVPQAMAIGMPNLTSGDIPPCGSNPVCSRSQFFNGLTKLPPAFQPFVTPAYSDVGYVLLAYALEKMTGRSFQESFEEKVIKPLNLTRTFYRAPADSLGVIPGDRWKTTWAFFMGNESPTGGLYSSSTDMAKVGRAILKSTLFPGPVTRRWLRPVTFSSDPSSSVGSPWGVRRLTLIGQSTAFFPLRPPILSPQFATTFNKLGSIGTYSALLAVIPDFDIGFSVAAAGEIPAALVTSIADTLAKTYLPTLQGVSRLQANASYAGYYKSETINSSVTISVDATAPGLGVGNWMSNGTSMMGLSVALSSNISRDYWDAMQPSVRLYPSGLWDALPNGGKKVGFKATFEDLAGPSVAEMYTTDCSTWIGMSGIVYGSQPLDEFVFELDKDGVAVAVENAALRSRMVKVV